MQPAADQRVDGAGQRARRQRAAGDDDLSAGRYRGDFLAHDAHVGLRGQLRLDQRAETFAVHRQRAAGRKNLLLGMGLAR